MSELITGSLQENILTALVFDNKAAAIIANAVEPGIFESDIYKDIIKSSLEYYKEFKEAPKEHIADLLEHKINDTKSPKTGEMYKRILVGLYSTKDTLNSDFVIKQLNQFIRRQKFKSALIECVSLVKQDTNEALDEAEDLVNKTLKSQIITFDRGLSFKDSGKFLQSARKALDEAYPMGVSYFDNNNIGPAKGELLVLLAPANRGKSWGLINIGRACAQHRLKILHITLEMPEGKVAQRYLQAFYSLAKTKINQTDLDSIAISKFEHDELHRLSGLQIDNIVRPSLYDNKIMERVGKHMEKYKNRIKLEIKQFPTSSLTIKGLEIFLDGLDRLYNYVPDVILLDYADLMKLDTTNLRISTGDIYKELRRVGQERDIAMVTASQANRLAEDARVITLKHLAEDYSKAATADTIIAYCQTSAEKGLGLARLFGAKVRNEENGQTVLISQAYKIGQFCMASTIINDRYWNLINDSNTSDSTETTENKPQTRRPRFKPRNKNNDS